MQGGRHLLIGGPRFHPPPLQSLLRGVGRTGLYQLWETVSAPALFETVQSIGAEPENRDEEFEESAGGGDEPRMGAEEDHGKTAGGGSRDEAAGAAVFDAGDRDGDYHGAGDDVNDLMEEK